MQPNSTIPPAMPAAVAAYFESTDPMAVARCFTEDAVVADERRRHHGRAEIAAWNAAAVASYGMTTAVRATHTEGARTTVRAEVSGNFPGSPIELQFRFTLADGLIAQLEIA